MMRQNSLESLFCPASVAVVGATESPGKLGGIVLANLLRVKGRLYPVNPSYREVMGLRSYPSVREIPEVVDLSIIIRPAAEVPGLLRHHAGKARFALIVSAGFAEVGETALQEELVRAGKESGVRLVGPNCLGIYNPRHRLDTMFLPHTCLRRPGRGNVAIVSQSGAIMICLLETIRRSNTGVSKVFNYGNAADIDAPEVYDYLAEDPDTSVVVSYLESIGDGRKFISAARRLADRKRLIVLRAGKGAGGQAAAFSHTGRLAGRYEVFHSILREFGIMEAPDYEGLADAAKALSYQGTSEGKRICIITNGGGSGVLASDECSKNGLELPPLPEKALRELVSAFPPFYVVKNPIDLTGQVRTEDYRIALRAVRDHYDGFVVIALTGVAGITAGLADILKEFRRETVKPLAVHIAQGGIAPHLCGLLEKAKIPVFPSPERAVRGVATLLGKDSHTGA